MHMPQRFVAYLRVSRESQGAMGLGMEAQRVAIASYARGAEIAAEYVEVESGRRSDNRPELAKAMMHAKGLQAVLIIAKLDRLARNVHFISGLMESGVEFVACDMPTANRLTIHILAAFAEHERQMISERTKAALQIAKSRGVKLGNPNGAAALRRWRKSNPPNTRAAIDVVRARTIARAAEIAPIIAAIRHDGATTLQAIADQLNARQVPTQRGGHWHPATVRLLLARL